MHPFHLAPATTRLVQHATRLAIELGHHYCGIEHIILAALSHDEAAAVGALQADGVPPSAFIGQLRDEIVRYTRLPAPPEDAPLPVTPRLATALEAGTPAHPLDPTALFDRLARDPRSLLGRLAASLGADPHRLAECLAGLVMERAPVPVPPDTTPLVNTITLAMYGQHRLDNLVADLHARNYELQVDSAIVGWLLLRELESEGVPGVIDRIFDTDLGPRLEAAMAEHPPGSVFCLTLGGDRVDLLIVKGKPED